MDPVTNTTTTDARMLILEADPTRYIRTPSGLVLALIKAAEGYVAFTLFFPLLDCLGKLFLEGKVMLPIRVFSKMLPDEIRILLFPENVRRIFLLKMLPVGEIIAKALGTIAAAAALVILICVMIDAVCSILLWVFMTGSQVMAITRRIIFYAVIVLAGSFAVSLLMEIICFYTKAYRGGAGRVILITLVITLVLALRISYEKGAATVMKAMAYEFKIKFKETTMPAVSIGRDALIFFLIFAIAAGMLAFFGGWKNLYVLGLGIYAFKHLAVYSCWMDWQKCHM